MASKQMTNRIKFGGEKEKKNMGIARKDSCDMLICEGLFSWGFFLKKIH